MANVHSFDTPEELIDIIYGTIPYTPKFTQYLKSFTKIIFFGLTNNRFPDRPWRFSMEFECNDVRQIIELNISDKILNDKERFDNFLKLLEEC